MWCIFHDLEYIVGASTQGTLPTDHLCSYPRQFTICLYGHAYSLLRSWADCCIVTKQGVAETRQDLIRYANATL